MGKKKKQTKNRPIIEKIKQTITIKQRHPPQQQFLANWFLKAQSPACRILLCVTGRRTAANKDTKGKELFLNAIYFLDLHCVRIQTRLIQLLPPTVFLPAYGFFWLFRKAEIRLGCMQEKPQGKGEPVIGSEAHRQSILYFMLFE